MEGRKNVRIKAKLAISWKQWEMEPLVTNTRWHTLFRMTWKLLTLDNLQCQCCNKNRIGCNSSLLGTTVFFCISTFCRYMFVCLSACLSVSNCKKSDANPGLQTANRTISNTLDITGSNVIARQLSMSWTRSDLSFSRGTETPLPNITGTQSA